jgi:glutathione S-transferase
MNSKGPALSILGIFKEFQERYVLARLKECSSDEDLKSAYEKKLENIRKSYSAEEKEECKSQLVTILKTAEESLSTNKFLAGPSFSLADILLGSLLVRLRDAGTIKVDLQSHPVVSTYFKDIQQRQSFKDTFTGAEFAIASLLITLRDLPSIFLSKLTGRY